jgi:hypothetical protein
MPISSNDDEILLCVEFHTDLHTINVFEVLAGFDGR